MERISRRAALYFITAGLVLHRKKGLKIFSFFAIVLSYLVILYYAQRPTEGFSGQWTNSFVHFQFFAAGILVSVF